MLYYNISLGVIVSILFTYTTIANIKSHGTKCYYSTFIFIGMAYLAGFFFSHVYSNETSIKEIEIISIHKSDIPLVIGKLGNETKIHLKCIEKEGKTVYVPGPEIKELDIKDHGGGE
ncbi:MAG: hypothetical protein KAK00_03180 [Nanoarchaeota archaeon]|nr:hypothetical protein [Nanoarchaeota archaeon]